MNRARKQGGGSATGAKNSVLPNPGSGKGLARPIKNTIAMKPGSQPCKVGNSLALKGKY